MKEYKSLDSLSTLAKLSVMLTASAHTSYCLLFYYFDITALMYFKLAEATVAWVAFGLSLVLSRYLNTFICFVRISLLFSCSVCNYYLGIDYGFVVLMVLIVSAGYIHNFKNAWVPLIMGMIEVSVVSAAAFFSYDNPVYQSNSQAFFNIFGVVFVSVAIVTYAILTEQANSLQQRQREIAEADMKRNLETDKLSGLYNRTTMSEILKRQIEYLHHENSSVNELCVALVDIDGLRKINESYGHRFGDLVIYNVAQIIRQQIAPHNGRIYSGRWSGQEFIISGLEASRDDFVELMQALAIEVGDFTHTDGYHSKNITISIGICANQRNKSIDFMLGKADTALYNCKRAGGNKIELITLAKDGI